jgi:hypothetical protein
MGTHSRSENGRSVWVALCTHSTHTDSPLIHEDLQGFVVLTAAGVKMTLCWYVGAV